MKSKVLVTREQLQSHKVLQEFKQIGIWKELVKYSQPIYKIKVTEVSELMVNI